MKCYLNSKTSEGNPKTIQVRPTSGQGYLPPVSGLAFIDNAVTAQRKENKTGMPDNLKSGIESLSGHDMSDVNVHYNSLKPAQLNALAYAQGNQIHLGPGQEKHLPHEAWHVAQQKQGRVQPTVQVKGTAVNNNPMLEQEAEVMGARANTSASAKNTAMPPVSNVMQNVAQRVKKLKLTGAVLATIFSLGLVWLSPGFRKYMGDLFADEPPNLTGTTGNTRDHEGNEEYDNKLQKNRFRTKAGLEDYTAAFGEEFEDHLFQLGEEERWMDGGAGIGKAIADYYESGGKARATAVAHTIPQDKTGTLDKLNRNQRFNYVSGDYFNAISNDKLLGEDLTKFSVITDYNGILSYTDKLSGDLQKYLDNLKVGGKLYTFFFATINEGEITPYEWVSMTKGVTVEGGNNKREMVITKIEEETRVVPLKLQEHKFLPGENIPERKFELTE